MSRGVNKAIIVGNLGQDVELRYAASGTAVANISVATSYKRGDNEETEWHRLVLFGKTAEVAAKYLHKGSQAYFEGRIVTRKWQDKTGADRYTTEIQAFEMQMLGKVDHDNTDHRQQPQHQPAGPGPGAGGPGKQETPAQDDGFDEIPF